MVMTRFTQLLGCSVPIQQAAMPHWAGESVDGVNQVQTAAEIMQELMADAEARLRGWTR